MLTLIYAHVLIQASEILKQPLHTTIAIDTLEFGEFVVEEKLHIVISVKDFKSIIAHAGITNTIVKALYSHPSSPMQITYSDEGVMCEFILMTIGESRGSSATPAPNTSRTASKRPASRQLPGATPSSRRVASSTMPPPPIATVASVSREAAKAKSTRPPPAPPQPSLPPSQALFHPEDEDRRWDPVNYDEEDDEMLLWDAGEDNVSVPTLCSLTTDGPTRSL
jgi:cell cycle checkpoint control protein RAD9A